MRVEYDEGLAVDFTPAELDRLRAVKETHDYDRRRDTRAGEKIRDDYENYNTLGRITRDVMDFTHIPVQLRLTGHPDRKPHEPLYDQVSVLTTILSLEDEEMIRDEYRNGRTIEVIASDWRIGRKRARRILKGVRRGE